MNNMETFWSTSHAAGAQSSYLESLYELYLKDPSTVPDDWKIYFDSLPIVSDEQHAHKIHSYRPSNLSLSSGD